MFPTNQLAGVLAQLGIPGGQGGGDAQTSPPPAPPSIPTMVNAPLPPASQLASAPTSTQSQPWAARHPNLDAFLEGISNGLASRLAPGAFQEHQANLREAQRQQLESQKEALAEQYRQQQLKMEQQQHEDERAHQDLQMQVGLLEHGFTPSPQQFDTHLPSIQQTLGIGGLPETHTNFSGVASHPTIPGGLTFGGLDWSPPVEQVDEHKGLMPVPANNPAAQAYNKDLSGKAKVENGMIWMRPELYKTYEPNADQQARELDKAIQGETSKLVGDMPTTAMDMVSRISKIEDPKVRSAMLGRVGDLMNYDSEKMSKRLLYSGMTPSEIATYEANAKKDTENRQYQSIQQDLERRKVAVSEGELALKRDTGKEQDAWDAKYPMYAGIPKPQRNGTINAVQAEQKSYNDEISQIEEFRDFIKAARGGNKAAYLSVPEAGVLAFNSGHGVRRMSPQQLKDWGVDIGDLGDKISGKIGGKISGADLSKGVLNSLWNMSSIMESNATLHHQRAMDAVNMFHGSKAQLQTLAPHLPESLIQSDVGKIYRTNDNRTVKIIDIKDPKHPTVEEVSNGR